MTIRKTLLLSVICCLLFAGNALAFDESWDYSDPSGTEDAGTLDTIITDFKKAVAERLNNDHWFDEDNTLMNELTAGDHRHVTMLEKQAAPSNAASTGIVYVIADGTDSELGYTDAGGNDVQLTADGALNLTGGYSITDLTVSNSLSVGNDVTVTDDISAGGDITASGYVYSGGNKVLTGFGAYETTDASQVGGSTVTLARATTYQTTCDGFVVCYFDANASGSANIQGKQGVSSGSLQVVQQDGVESSSTTGNDLSSISYPVKSGYYWRVDMSGNSALYSYKIYFMPIS